VVTIAGAVVVLVSAFLPWHLSGEAHRNSFDLARVADTLGEVDRPFERAALWAWYAVPVLVAAAWLAATFRRPVLVATLGGTVGLLAVLASMVMVLSPLPMEAGPRLALPAGIVTVAGAIVLARPDRRPS
jgi:hypothetical protein